MANAQQDIRALRGVGEQRAQTLQKLGVRTVGDLLMHYPRGYIDLSKPCEIAAAPLETPCSVLATVIKKHGEARLR